MTIFHSRLAIGDWKIWLAQVFAALGLVGFLTCWITLGIGEYRVVGAAALTSPSEARPAKIEAKGHSYFVEKGYAYRYNLAQTLIFYVWILGAGGGLYLNFRQRKGARK